jgi:hypothetical protein
MKWFSLAIAAVGLSVAADAQARDFWRTPSPVTSQVYHSNGVELAGDTPHRWYHQPAGYGLHVKYINHGYYTGNAWYNNNDFHNNSFYHGAHGWQGCRSFQDLWSSFCQDKCRKHRKRGCNRCGKSKHRGCGCDRDHRHHGGCGHLGHGSGHHHPDYEPADDAAPTKPEEAAPDPPAPKPDVSAGLFENWPRPFAFLSDKQER